jgi:hypothetical protein
MPTALPTSLSSTSYHKMDNILYEIRDNKGIPKNKFYEPWKKEILKELKNFGFIIQKSDLYVITEAGLDVIKNVSFKVYNHKNKSGIKEAEEDLQKPTKKGGVKFWFLLLVFAQLFIVTTLSLFWF